MRARMLPLSPATILDDKNSGLVGSIGLLPYFFGKVIYT